MFFTFYENLDYNEKNPKNFFLDEPNWGQKCEEAGDEIMDVHFPAKML